MHQRVGTPAGKQTSLMRARQCPYRAGLNVTKSDYQANLVVTATASSYGMGSIIALETAFGAWRSIAQPLDDSDSRDYFDRCHQPHFGKAQTRTTTAQPSNSRHDHLQ
jgi:hypothetical protein